MKHNVEQSVSLWMATAKASAQPVLASDTQADICVVGAGIAGFTTAYLLAREGRSVVVLDDGPLAGGQSQRTTAHLSNALDAGKGVALLRHGFGGHPLHKKSERH